MWLCFNTAKVMKICILKEHDDLTDDELKKKKELEAALKQLR
jgi:hypothetical protein